MTDTTVISTVPNFGTLVIDYDFYSVPDTMDIYYDGAHVFSSGLTSGAGQFTIAYGPGGADSLTIIMNQDGNAYDTTWTYQPTVVPEPGVLALAGLGMPTLFFFRRRIRKTVR